MNSKMTYLSWSLRNGSCKTCFQNFQVRTLLENPTRYHVVQKQKNQVRQYLHESFRNSSEHYLDGSLGSDGLGSHSAKNYEPIDPMTVQNVSSLANVSHLQHHNGSGGHFVLNPQGPMNAINGNHRPQQHQHQQHPQQQSAEPSPEIRQGAMSPALSSVATSNSEVKKFFFYIV